MTKAILAGLALSLAPAGSASAAGNGVLAFGVFIPTVSCSESPDCYDQRVVLLRLRDATRTVLRTCEFRDCGDGWPAWAPGGRKLAVDRLARIVLAERDGSGVRELGLGARPVWSPDARRLVFEGPPLPRPCCFTQSDLFSMRTDGSEKRRLTFEGGAFASWSRAGIAFQRADRRARADVYVLPTSRGRAIRLTQGGSGSMPDWSPGGGRIVYVARVDRRSLLAIMDRRGRLQRYLPSTIDRGSERRPKKPTWSPDGNWIAFSRGRSLELIHPDGTGLRTVLTLKRPNSFSGLDWQPRP